MAGRRFIIARRRQAWSHRFLNTPPLARLRAVCFIEVQSFPHSKATSFLAACEVSESFGSSPTEDRWSARRTCWNTSTVAFAISPKDQTASFTFQARTVTDGESRLLMTIGF